MNRSTFLLIMSSAFLMFNNSTSAMDINRVFTKEVDRLLIKTVQKNPRSKWNAIANTVSEKARRQVTGEECKKRYKQIECRKPWTKEDDRLILVYADSLKKNWVRVSARLKSERTPLAVKYRYETIIDKLAPFQIDLKTADGMQQAIDILHKNGGKTSASAQPVAEPAQTAPNQPISIFSQEQWDDLYASFLEFVREMSASLQSVATPAPTAPTQPAAEQAQPEENLFDFDEDSISFSANDDIDQSDDGRFNYF